MFNNYSITNVRRLVDKYFSLQWCRDNYVVPLSLNKESQSEVRTIIMAIANYSYLGTISEPIKSRLSESGQKCLFVEKTQEEIQEILDKASEEQFISGEFDETVLFENDYLSNSTEPAFDKKVEEFMFEFDADIGLDIGNEIIDLVPEMMESKIKKAVGLVLIYSKKEKVSEIYVDPKEDSYKISVRKDGVSQRFISMPKESGILFLKCLKVMANMDTTDKENIQDGKIMRKFEGQKLELNCSTKLSLNGESMALKFFKSDPSTLNLDTLIHIENVLHEFYKYSIKRGNLNS